MLGCEGHNLTWFADPVNHLEPLETFLLRLHLDKGPRTTKQPPGFIERQKKQLYISTEVHARDQSETDEDGADLPLADTQEEEEEEEVRNKDGDTRDLNCTEWGESWGCVCEDTMYISRILLVGRKLMTIQLFNQLMISMYDYNRTTI